MIRWSAASRADVTARGRLPPTNEPAPLIGRREFVQGATVTGVLSGVLGAFNPLNRLLAHRAWAVDLHALSPGEASTLSAMIHTIAPHDGLDEAAYALVIGALDTAAAAEPATHELLRAGLRDLSEGFAQKSEAVRVKQLEAVEWAPFFQSVRLKTLMVLYNNPIAWAHFGYEGEAFSKGGYLLRGFNDLKWLPEVPLDAAGPAPL